MIENFGEKRKLQMDDVNSRIKSDAYVSECEGAYSARVGAMADEIIERGVKIVMASGPSASGKTTSCKRLAQALVFRGHRATVVSLDDFFKNIEDYPRLPDGSPDMDNVQAVDIPLVNACLKELVDTGTTVIPQFDFVAQRRSEKTLAIDASCGGIAIVEGIHALNPILSETLSDAEMLRMYVGLREEYYADKKRLVPTRDLRIVRRLVRDRLFRGYPAEATLDSWGNIVRGENLYVKPFKERADLLLDSSLSYEPCVLAPLLTALVADSTEGGEHRDTLERLEREFSYFVPADAAAVPKNSLLREFIGGLEL